MRRLFLCLTLGVFLASGVAVVPSYAQSGSEPAAAAASSPTVEQQMSELRQQVAEARSSGDNAWMLVCAALVLMMTGPGLALFYGGLVRKKNVLGTMMQSFAMMAVITVLWAIVGYSLAFGPGHSFIGGFHNLFLHGVGVQPDPDYAATIPNQTFMVYQLMFAIITPALITGAFAERMKFSAMLLFLTLWSLFVYDPMAHMVWGKGGLLNAALGGRFPTLDFAGGTAVAELRHAAGRLQGRRQASHAGRKLLFLAGVGFGLLYNPITGPETRRWLKQKLSGGSEFGFGDDQSGNGSAG